MSFENIHFVDVSQFENTQEDCKPPTLKRKHFTVAKVYDDLAEIPAPTESITKIAGAVPKKTIHEEILDTLKMVLNNQEILGERLSAIECTISDTEKTLNHKLDTIQLNQAVLSQNQENLSKKLEKIEMNLNDNAVLNAQNMLLRECKAGGPKIATSVCRSSAEIDEEYRENITNSLPLETLADIGDVEKKLDNPEYAQAMRTYFHKLKGSSEDVCSVIRYLFTDEVLELYNWDGRWDKLPLNKLYMVDSILRDVFKKQGAFRFERSLKKSIELSHHRAKQKKYVERKNKANTLI